MTEKPESARKPGSPGKAKKRPRRPPRWYFSLRSPYAWLTYRDLTERHPDLLDQLEWAPFWEPNADTQRMLDEARVELPIVAMSRAKAFYVLQDVARLTKARGMTMTWPVDREPNWEVSHLAYLVAQREGAGRRFVDLAYRARFEEGRDISERDTMGEIAAELGLKPDLLADASDDPEARRLALASLTEAYKDGVFGVPFFVHGRDKYWGMERLPFFVAACLDQPLDEVEKAWHEYVELPRFSEPQGEPGHAGGCG